MARALSAEEQKQAAELTDKAMLDLLAGRYADAASRARAAVDIDGRAARARAVLGHCLLEEARREDPPEMQALQRAEGELLLAHRLAPEDSQVHFLLARFFILEGHRTRAAAELKKLLQGSPEHEPALRAAAELHYEMGEEREARRLLLRLQATGPDDLTVYRLAWCEARIAETLLQEPGRQQGESRKMWESAVKRFAHYSRLQPKDPAGPMAEAHIRLRLLQAAGTATSSKDEVARIQALYAAAARLAPKDAEPLFSQGRVFEELGDTVGARRLYQEALLRDRDHVPSLLNLAALLDEAGEKDAARNIVRHALTLEVSQEERRGLKNYLK